MATQKLDLCGILKESSQITNSHSRHFLALSVLFLLPLSFSMIAFPTLQHSIADITTSQPVQFLLRLRLHHQPIALKPLFFALLFALTFLTLLLSATATITYSFYNGFFGRPVKLASSIKSLSNSLIRSFATVFCAGSVVLGSVVGVGLVALGVVRGIEELGFEVAYSSSGCFRVFQWVGVGVLGLALLWLYVNWVLAPVVVVVESSWGFEPLRRSAYLVKGMRGGVVCLVLYFGGILWFLVFGSWGTSVGSGVLGALWFVATTVLCSACIMVFLLQSVAANTLLYVKCKALRGELAGEIVEEFAQEYMSLPFDEPKVPRLVSILQP